MKPVNLALDAALALARNPSLVRGMRRQPPPPGLKTLLQMLAGDAALAQEAARAARLEPEWLLICVERYVQETMLYPGAPPRRALGVTDFASAEDMRAHMKLLMMWLHPDRSDDPWRAAFAGRVLAAWKAAQQGASAAAPAARRQRSAPSRLAWVKHPLPPKRRRRWPFITATMLIALAVVALLQFWPLNLAPTAPPPTADRQELQ